MVIHSATRPAQYSAPLLYHMAKYRDTMSAGAQVSQIHEFAPRTRMVSINLAKARLIGRTAHPHMTIDIELRLEPSKSSRALLRLHRPVGNSEPLDRRLRMFLARHCECSARKMSFARRYGTEVQNDGQLCVDVQVESPRSADETQRRARPGD
jgi:hypothetical protein